ncbi:LON peptidase substrate-binding domain-containing protein [Sphingosinicella sp. LHD-64]|uniref:LON peptidase substrate-binding domain-containing protein n=1 Tax=Sphingosinicella sp. LHD-64 TaxID=3072139 RepID=UPI00280D4E5E|nr:LON peptidase substrate-binding domain-containing protein [Sphingosinicella sp. LHD-64]MDQ8757053.1 LON peptidase substrate-binding domain-containing protein [Sphingosinicella sp. LHD-64]
MHETALLRVPIFPLVGALLFPRGQLPLHIFEPRYRAMVRDALDGDRLIAMIQPRPALDDSREMIAPPIFEIGCIGRLAGCEELDDGRFNIVLEGLSRFRVAREARVETLYRQVDADRSGFNDQDEDEPLAIAQRAEIERESRAYADALGYAVDWESVARLDDEMLVNGIAQIAPLDVGSKQALLEARDLTARADLLVQFMQFQRMAPGGADGPATLQ